MTEEDISTVDVLLEFLEAAVHQVLFVRRLYSEELFGRQRLYGIAVRKSRHPDLNEYIQGAVTSLRNSLVRGTLSKLVVLVRRADGTPVERFVVEPRLLGNVEVAAPDLEAIEAQLRGTLLKLQYCDSYLTTLPAGCSFELCAYTSSRSDVDPQTWAEELRPRAPQQPGSSARGADAAPRFELSAAEIVPIKSCCLEGAFQLQLYAEAS